MSEDQSINRREVLLGAIALVGGATSLAGCSRDEIDQLDLHSGELVFFDRDQMQVLSRVADVVIPETDTPGALGADVHIFLDQLMANWASAKTQAMYVALLAAIDENAQAECGEAFADCSPEQQEQLIVAVDAAAFSDERAMPEFRELKQLILAGYYTSEIGATVELQFELVPGRYVPCAPIEEIGRAWA